MGLPFRTAQSSVAWGYYGRRDDGGYGFAYRKYGEFLGEEEAVLQDLLTKLQDSQLGIRRLAQRVAGELGIELAQAQRIVYASQGITPPSDDENEARKWPTPEGAEQELAKVPDGIDELLRAINKSPNVMRHNAEVVATFLQSRGQIYEQPEAAPEAEVQPEGRWRWFADWCQEAMGRPATTDDILHYFPAQWIADLADAAMAERNGERAEGEQDQPPASNSSGSNDNGKARQTGAKRSGKSKSRQSTTADLPLTTSAASE